ncbi:hypothetical protein LTR05_008099 [Lithohypha guttulata]|uniref:Heterokaryon incompatibility domain-containing protein n=1 Tax=Lithohypha guttulata TaxID=1690604 RepID=A0AAN7Y8P0_9EURO|nr:hypothetical protein LTR05_008099 [Lithohypha guttulata]
MDWQQLEHKSHLEDDPTWIEARRMFQSYTPGDHHLETKSLSIRDAYVYKPLNAYNREIRILTLQPFLTPPDGHEPIVCGSLQEISLDSSPFYFALSYVWGVASQTFPIILDGRIFNVTTTLHSALRQLSQKGYALPIWIDAICINQSDSLEKSSQVQEMGSIYRNAQLVLGWLGPEARSSSLAIKALSFLGSRCMNMPDGPSLQERYDLVTTVLPSDPADKRLAFPTSSVVALLNRPWWYRVWVVQEVVLAKNVYLLCGDSDVQFSFLLLGFTMVFELPLLDAVFQGSLGARIMPLLPILKCDPRIMNAAIRGHSQEPAPLSQRMEEVRSLGATDARDHILALLGMVSDASEVGIKADYTKSCAEIYTQVASGLMINQRNLQILSHCSFPKTQKNLPSWVPDWSTGFSYHIWQSKYSLFRTGSRHNQRTKMQAGNFVISGSRFDVITNTGYSWNKTDLTVEPDTEPVVLSACLGAIEDFVRRNCSAYRSSKEIDDAVWRTPICDTESGVFSDTGRKCIRATANTRAGFEALRHPENLTNIADENKRLQKAKSFQYKAGMIGALSNRRIFVTAKGYVGVGPGHLQADDHICIFWGAEVPYVLRERRDINHTQKKRFWQRDKGDFEFLGECYVHGIMDGEKDLRTSTGEDFVLH